MKFRKITTKLLNMFFNEKKGGKICDIEKKSLLKKRKIYFEYREFTRGSKVLSTILTIYYTFIFVIYNDSV